MQQIDFSQGSIRRRILAVATPMLIAQLLNLLYNIVDRIYIGKIPGEGTLALASIGLCFPFVTLITAFANLFGLGGAPLCAMARGKGNREGAQGIMVNAGFMLLLSGAVLTVLGIAFHRPLLHLFGASEVTYPYASSYIVIYLIGTLCVMLSLGLNPYINCQGFARTGMLTVALGAAANIVLDPIFIFMLHMGIRGAALATILSQLLSAIWILRFLTSDKTILKLRRSSMHLSARRIRKIVGLGLSGFTMAITNCTVQIMCNATLQVYGGDLYVGVMTVINSIREIATLPVTGVTHSAQPVLGFNYGAKEYGRVKKAIVFTSFIAILYTTGIWLIVDGFPAFFIRIFNQDAELIAAGIPAIRLYFFGFFMMSLQFSGQSIFVGLGESKKAIFFSIFRKVIIVVPLTILLPGMFGMGTNGVFAAEPITNFIGGIACFGTMLFTIWRKLTKLQKQEAV